MTMSRRERQEIFSEFVSRHGVWKGEMFIEEVRAKGPDHPAYYGWFDGFDQEAAATREWLRRARDFVNDLRIETTITAPEPVTDFHIETVSAPLAISPLSSRNDGGGYYEFDPDNPEHVAELAKQGSLALVAWIERYGLALAKSGGKIEEFERVAQLLSDHSRELRSLDVLEAAE